MNKDVKEIMSEVIATLKRDIAGGFTWWIHDNNVIIQYNLKTKCITFTKRLHISNDLVREFRVDVIAFTIKDKIKKTIKKELQEIEYKL